MRRRRKPKGPQTSKKRKAGTRVNSSAFNTIGKTLNEDLEESSKSHGIGFRKKAGRLVWNLFEVFSILMVLCSKRAREERALAAEQRIQALQGKASSSNLVPPVVGDDSESEDEKSDTETDYDRRRTLLEVIEEKDLDALRATMFDPAQDFLLPSVGSSCGVEDPRDSITSSTFGAVSGPASGGFSRIKTSPSDEDCIRPRKKRKTSQSKLIFTSQTTPAVTETTKAEREDPWDCIICTL